MTPAQQAALDALAAGQKPRIAASTARVLADQYRYISRGETGEWELTPAAWNHLARHRAAELRRLADAQLTDVDRAWGERVWAWWVVAGESEGWLGYGLQAIVKRVAAYRHAGIEPPAEKLTGDDARLYDLVATAEGILRDLDTQMELATARGVRVTVDFQADGRVPRSRQDATAAATADGVVDLRAYRERRPDPGPGAA